MNPTQPEADAAGLRLAFTNATNTYPQHLAQFLSKDAEAAFRDWWGKFYAAVRDSTAGLALLAELQRLRELDELRRQELADTDAALAEANERGRLRRERLAVLVGMLQECAG